MRLIDADALIDTLGISDEEIDFKEILREAPTIEAASIDDYRSMENTCYKLQKALYEKADAVSVVRCKECRRSYIEGQTTLYRVCELHDITTDENNYCSWGEREGE